MGLRFSFVQSNMFKQLSPFYKVGNPSPGQEFPPPLKPKKPCPELVYSTPHRHRLFI